MNRKKGKAAAGNLLKKKIIRDQAVLSATHFRWVDV